MKAARMATLKGFALFFLGLGMAGLIVSSLISMQYLNTLPQSPVPEEMRVTPRAIHGMVVYQTKEEDRKLNLIDRSAVTEFIIGIVLGVVYMEKWGSAQSHAAEEEDDMA
jgi:hypothetical protein